MRAAAALAAIALAGCHPAPRPIVIENRVERLPEADHRGYRGAITEENLLALMRRRFASQIAAGTFVADFNGTTADLLAELAAMGITDIGQLARLIPSDYDRSAAADFNTASPANIPGVLRDVFIIHDAHRYFGNAWQHHWGSLSSQSLPLYRHYHVDLSVLDDAGVLPGGPSDASPPPPP
jgi:hypothetical protein